MQLDFLSLLLGVALGGVAGAALAAWRVRQGAAEAETRLKADLARAEAQLEEKARFIADMGEQMTGSFEKLSTAALDASSDRFLKLAEEHLKRFQESAQGDLARRQQAIGEMVQPVRETLEKMDQKVAELEKNRAVAYQGLHDQAEQLRRETQTLSRVLKRPEGRGQWGEMQLETVAEMAGMVKGVDFETQSTIAGPEGKLRPDMKVRLPGGKCLFVDAKAPLEAYHEAMAAEDDATRQQALLRHARVVREHMRGLGQRGYWEQLDETPEFVVMFLPAESFFQAALEQDTDLIRTGVTDKVILATPTTLIALFKAVVYGWRQERMADSAREIAGLGAELHKRLSVFTGHLDKVGTQLGRAVKSYNDAVGSLDRSVLPKAREFQKHKVVAADAALPEPQPVELHPRESAAPEARGPRALPDS